MGPNIRRKKGENVNSRSALFTAGVIVLAALLAPAVPVHAADHPEKNAATGVEIICLTAPFIWAGESATLQALAITFDGRPITTPIKFEWEVSAGRIKAQAAVAEWDLSTVKDVVPFGRKVLATVKATQPGRSELRCKVEVFVRPHGVSHLASPLSVISARRFLLPGKEEEPGYGLYSYLLFSAPPKNADERARYLKTIEAYLWVLEDVDYYLGANVPRSTLNATYIPLKKWPDPVKGVDRMPALAENVLAVYDYATSQILLSRVQQAHHQGPYLLSVLQPLSEPGKPAYLWEDLTGVAPELAWNWVKFFTYLAAQERSWSESSLQRFGLKLRNVVAVGGKVTPDVLKGLEKAIQFKL